MVVHERRHKALVDRVRSTLEKGLNIAVIGWKDSNHSNETRAIAKTLKVRFYQEIPREIGSSIGLVLLTKFNGHAYHPKLDRYAHIHPSCIPNNQIKSVLGECKDLIFKAVPVESDIVFNTPVGRVPTVATKEVLIPDFTVSVESTIRSIVAPVSTEGIMTKEVTQEIQSSVAEEVADLNKFNRLFLEAFNEGGPVGKITLGKIRRDCGMTSWSNAVLAKKGLIEGVLGEGRNKVGRYKPTEKLISQHAKTGESRRVTISPEDPLYEVYVLIESEDSVKSNFTRLNQEMQLLQIEIDALDLRLKNISKAKETLESLRALVK